MLKVGDETGHHQQVNLAYTKDLVGDEMAIMLGTLG